MNKKSDGRPHSSNLIVSLQMSANWVFQRDELYALPLLSLPALAAIDEALIEIEKLGRAERAISVRRFLVILLLSLISLFTAALYRRALPAIVVCLSLAVAVVSQRFCLVKAAERKIRYVLSQTNIKLKGYALMRLTDKRLRPLSPLFGLRLQLETAARDFPLFDISDIEDERAVRCCSLASVLSIIEEESGEEQPSTIEMSLLRPVNRKVVSAPSATFDVQSICIVSA